MATKIIQDQRNGYIKIVRDTQFVDKELEARLDEEIIALTKKYAPDVKEFDACLAKINDLRKKQEEAEEAKKVVEKRLNNIGLDKEEGSYSNDYTPGNWGLTWHKKEGLTEKLNGKFKDYKEHIIKKIIGSQSIEIAEALVDEYLARNKSK